MKTNLNSKLASKARVNVAVLGASGYTGLETIRVLLKHPKVKIKALVGEKTKGKTLGEVCSPVSNIELPKIISFQQVDFNRLETS